MPANAKVFVHYGPYESCGIVEHRIERLQGLKTVLENNGHSVLFVQINDQNAVELWVNGELVMTTNIKDLDYGGDGKLDKLCTGALQKVNKAF